MSKTTDYVIETMNEEIEANDFSTEELEKMMLIKKARDFWNTPFDELVAKAENGEEGYGVMEDPTEPQTIRFDAVNGIRHYE
tara:strand:+ start:305 stop:550 length:246 start_codon:yes stop_codon:yes gene_type:complete